MKFNAKILSIPPYISTSWKNVISLRTETSGDYILLIVELVNGSIIEVPGLNKEAVEAVFQAHEKFLEGEMTPPLPLSQNPADGISFALPMGDGAGMNNVLQHNPEASDTPDLPPEILERISNMAKSIGMTTRENFPKPEPHCNCMHCQIMRSIQEDDASPAPFIEEMDGDEVSDEDLKFSDWEIYRSSNDLYEVKNPLNKEEHYNVFLGNPVGCTCGKKDCEHIKAVLNS